MTPASISDYILRTFDHVEVASAYGDMFFFYNPAPAGPNEVYFATVKVSDHDLDKASGLDRLGAFRLNLGVRRATFVSLFGANRGAATSPGIAQKYDYSEVNRLLPHPVYGGANWICVLNPTAATFEQNVAPLIAEAYARAVWQYTHRRGGKREP
jgi:hypothetical protein